MSEKNELYKGKARVINIGAEELAPKTAETLPDSDKGNAFSVVFDCETDEDPSRRFDVKLEISHRPLPAKMLEWIKRDDGKTPTRIDMTLRDLIKQGLLPRGAVESDIGAVMAEANLGREVTIQVTEDAKGDGTYWPPRARFVSPFSRLTGKAAADRFAAFLSGKPTPAPEPVPTADEGDPDNLPF